MQCAKMSLYMFVYIYIESHTSTQQSTLLNHTTHTRRGWREEDTEIKASGIDVYIQIDSRTCAV